MFLSHAIISSLQQAHATQSPKNLGERPDMIKGIQRISHEFNPLVHSCYFMPPKSSKIDQNWLNCKHVFLCRGFVCSEVLRLDAKRVLSFFQPEGHTNPRCKCAQTYSTVTCNDMHTPCISVCLYVIVCPCMSVCVSVYMSEHACKSACHVLYVWMPVCPHV